MYIPNKRRFIVNTKIIANDNLNMNRFTEDWIGFIFIHLIYTPIL